MCTNLMLTLPNITAAGAPDGTLVVSARCMEMPGPIPTSVYVVPSGQHFPLNQAGSPFPIAKPVPWVSQYGFVAAGNAEPGFTEVPTFIDGINEQGLSAAALWLNGTDYAAPSSANAVSFLDFVGWILGNCDSVQDLKSQLSSITVVGPPPPAPGAKSPYTPLHFVATDATGASLIMECLDGHLVQYDSSNGVMTNQPTYDWQVQNVANYAGLTPIGGATQTVKAAGEVPVGGGQLGMPGDSTSQSRFVKAWLTVESINELLPSDGSGWLPAPDGGDIAYAYAQQTAVTTAFQTVQIAMTTPYAMLLEGTPPPTTDAPLDPPVPGDYTQWTTVRDHTNTTYFFSAAFSGILSSVALTPELLAQAADRGDYTEYLSVPLMPAPGAAWCEPVTFS